MLAPSARGDWRHVTAADNLPEGTPTVLVEDHAGRIWIGTSGGLGCYDGVTWQQIEPFPTAPGRAISAIAEDTRGTIWVGGESGLALLDEGRWVVVSESVAPAAAVRSILASPNGDVWVGFRVHGVARFRDGSWSRWDREALGSNEIADGVIDVTGLPWFATGAGLIRYTGEAWATLPVAGVVERVFTDRSGHVWSAGDDPLRRWPDPLPFATNLTQVSALVEDTTGTTWIGAESGLFRLTDHALEPIRTDLDEPGVAILLPDGRGGVWVGGSSRGLSRVDAFTRRTYPESEVGGDRILVAQLDRSGNVWFGTDGPAGISETDGSGWTDFSEVLHAADPGGNRVLTSARFTDGSLGFGTDDGVVFFDGVNWRFEAPLTGAAEVRALAEDLDGTIWAGTSSGLARRSSLGWDVVIPAIAIGALYQDPGGDLWVGADDIGILRFRAGSIDTLSTQIGNRRARTRAFVSGDDGSTWAGTDRGLLRFRGDDREVIQASPDGLVSNAVQDLARDTIGRIWVATAQGIGIEDHGSWSRFADPEPGLTSAISWSLMIDVRGDVWVGTREGVSRNSNGLWNSFGAADGLPGSQVLTMVEDPAGLAWFGTPEGLARFAVDRVPPRTVFTPTPTRLVANRELTVSYTAADGETRGVFFTVDIREMDTGAVVDGSRGETTARFFSTTLPGDGRYGAFVRSRDALGNVEVGEAKALFEVDATPPLPVLTAPRVGDPVQGVVSIEGSADDSRFRDYRIDVRRLDQDWSSVTRGESRIVNGHLGTWDSRTTADGDYRLRLSVADTLDLTGVIEIPIIVDNEAPFAAETSPVLVVAGIGGDIWTTRREAHLYLPPMAIRQDETVRLELPLSEGGVDDANGGTTAEPTRLVRVSFGGESLDRSGVLDLDIVGLRDQDALVVNWRPDESFAWTAIGGTLQEGESRIAIPIRDEGDYALFIDGAPPVQSEAIGPVVTTPRVLHNGSGTQPGGVMVSFPLGREASVTVRIFNRSGRLVREVVSGLLLGPGENVVRWDGRTDGGDLVESGLFFVSVQAGNSSRTTSLAVVR